MNEHIVIIGGGFGGLAAARKLKHAPVDITLIDRRNHHLFQPLLYQVATGELSPADIATPFRRLLKQQRNVKTVVGEVVRIDAIGKQVRLSDGQNINYGRLIVAAGAGHNYFGNEAWQEHAPGLKTIEDAIEIRRRILTAFENAERMTDPDKIRACLTFVVIGGGPTGVELAGALAEIAHQTFKRGFHSIQPSDANIILIQSQARILPMYDDVSSTSARDALERMGVTVMTNARVIDVSNEHVIVDTVDGSLTIPTQTALWAVGVKASPLGRVLARSTGVALDRGARVIVGEDCTIPGFPDIFVIGDLAHFATQEGTPLPGVAQVAIQQGKYVARVITRQLQGKSISPFKYVDRGNLATIGRGAAVAEIGKFRFSGVLAWQIWLVIHLMYQLDFENRILVLIQWMWNFFTGDRSALLMIDYEKPSQGAVEAKYATDTGTWPSTQ